MASESWSLWLALALAALVSLLLLRARWNRRVIPGLNPHPSGRDPDCMVVIPARNEEAVIARAVRSLPHDSVIVVDDHSEDATVEAARKAGAGVIPAPDLPRGAMGKANACLAGARALESRWILFADADTCFAEGFLKAAVAAAEAKDLAFLSIHLEPRPQSWFDSLVAPLAEAIYYAGIRPRGKSPTGFRGQCVLVRRSAYEFVGGHGAVLNTLDETRLAALAARHQLKAGVARAGALGWVCFRDAGASIRRRGYRLLLLDRWTVTAPIAGATMMALWPAAALLVGIEGQWIWAAALLLVPALIAMLWYRSLLALLMPLGVYALAARLWSGWIAALGGRRVEWKGRRI